MLAFSVSFLNSTIPVSWGFLNASKYTFETNVTIIAIWWHSGLKISSLKWIVCQTVISRSVKTSV